MIIAVDGYSSTGKSSLAKEIAKKLNYVHIDTGAMYRAITLYAMQYCHDSESDNIDEQCVIESLPNIHCEFRQVGDKFHVFLDGKDVENEIRQLPVSKNVSHIAQIPEVREYLVKIQRRLGEENNIVMDGRDIGTVVFPDADIKFFITADLDERARRRYKDLKKTKPETTLEEVQENLMERDKADTERKHSPLKQADDAILIDNTHQTKEETVQQMLDYIKKNNT